ncbi:MAG: aminopeptidase [Bacteroidales bacterium]|nr:aminopeptidase [Bacteroidales bacterium]
MVKRMKQFALIALLLLVISPAFAQEFEQKLQAAATECGIKVSGIKALEIGKRVKDLYSEKYQLFIEQPIDHTNPAVGTFRQKVVLMHTGYDNPMVLVTEGYSSRGAGANYSNELSTMFNANMIEVEHRYFSESIPFMQDDPSITDETLNWDYMTARNEAADLHRVNQLFKKLYSGKWIATGISKGGQTAMFYTTYYPQDIDISVPYVGPLCKGQEDGRHEPFLAEFAGTERDREILRNFQIEFLKRRDKIQPMFEELSAKDKLTYKMPLEAVYDYCVLEFPFAFWQWGYSTDIVPDPKTATDKQMFDFLVKTSGPDYFAEGGSSAPFFVQAAKELGYYGYDTKPFKGLLTIKDAEGYLTKLFVPQSQTFTFDKYLYKDIKKFLETTDSKMMFIYGEFDPWSAVMPVAPVKNEALKAKGKGRKTMHLFVEPGGSHRARINTLPEEMKKEAIAILKEWLAE